MRVLDRVDLCQSPASLENGITHERLLSLEPILKTRVGLQSVLLRLKQIFSFQPPAKDVERNTAICKSITSPGRVDNKEQYVTKRPITVQFSNIIPPWKKQTRNDTGLLAVSPCQCHTEGGCLSSFLPPFFFLFDGKSKGFSRVCCRSRQTLDILPLLTFLCYLHKGC